MTIVGFPSDKAWDRGKLIEKRMHTSQAATHEEAILLFLEVEGPATTSVLCGLRGGDRQAAMRCLKRLEKAGKLFSERTSGFPVELRWFIPDKTGRQGKPPSDPSPPDDDLPPFPGAAALRA